MSWVTTTSALANTAAVAAASPVSQSKQWLSCLPSRSVADDRGVRRQRGAGVDDRGQQLVVDVDQLERIPCGVTVFGDDEGHLLPLEADLVGGQDGLDVVAQGRHPGQAAGGQVLAR